MAKRKFLTYLIFSSFLLFFFGLSQLFHCSDCERWRWRQQRWKKRRSKRRGLIGVCIPPFLVSFFHFSLSPSAMDPSANTHASGEIRSLFINNCARVRKQSTSATPTVTRMLQPNQHGCHGNPQTLHPQPPPPPESSWTLHPLPHIPTVREFIGPSPLTMLPLLHDLTGLFILNHT